MSSDERIRSDPTKEDHPKQLKSEDSRDDENLVQNWSLTYTEYEHQYSDGPATSRASKGGHVTDRLQVIDRDVKFTPIDAHSLLSADDGRNSEFPRRSVFPKPTDTSSMQEAYKQQIAENFSNLERTKALYLQGKRVQNDPVTDRVRLSVREPEGVKYFNGDSHTEAGVTGTTLYTNRNDANGRETHKGDVTNGRARPARIDENTEHPSQTTADGVTDGDNDGNLSRHSVLPPLESKSHVTGSDRILENGFPKSGTELSSVSNAMSVASGNKPPRNTPYTENGGRVQQIYMRFPGQITGQRLFAEMNEESGQVRIVGRDKDKEMLARLCWLLLDAGTSALRYTFDSIHPPVSLREHLNQQHVKAILHKLHQQTVLTDKQWKLLYPIKKKHTSSQKYDSRTLVTLLETICHMCPPYPHGWTKEPLPTDGSLSADILRLQLLFQDLATYESIPGSMYTMLFVQIRDVIVRLGGPPVRIKISRIETELISLDMQQHYIKTLREMWQSDVVKKMEKMYEMRSKTSRTRKTYADKATDDGLSPEDRVTLKKTYKLLVDNIPAEDVLDRLQQSQVIKFTDRQEILQVNKRSERMQLLLDKILDSKLPYALKALFDAIKFKYKKVYELVMSIRKQTYKEGVVTTVDVSGLTHDALVNEYKNKFSRITPLPWNSSVHASIRDAFTPLDIVDSDGKKLHISELLPHPAVFGKGQRIVLEGPSGSGKTFLCTWLAYMWATQNHFFRNQYRHVLYLNTYNLQGNLENAIYKDVFPDNFKIGLSDFWSMIERNPKDVLFIIDGYDHLQSVDLSEILSGTRFRESTVLVTQSPQTPIKDGFQPDTKWFNLGFSETNLRKCFRTAVVLSQYDHDQFEKLYFLAGKENWLLRPHLASRPMLAVTAFAIYDILRKSTILKEMKTPSDLLEKYGVAMAVLYCRKHSIDIIGYEFPDTVLGAIGELYKLSFTCSVENKLLLTEAEVLEKTKNPIVLKFGAFSRSTNKAYLTFTSRLTMEFLAARYIADMVYEDIEDTLRDNKMVKLPKYTELMSFLYCQYRDDQDTPLLEALFDKLASRNEYCVRGKLLPAPSVSSSPDAEVKVKVPRGVLPDFYTSLQCLAECLDRPDMVKMITRTLPQRLLIKIEGIVPLKVLQGLRLALDHEECNVSEIEIDFHQYHYHQLPAISQVAKATGRCRNIHSIKITWSSLDIMSHFLAGVMETTQSIEHVTLSEDLSRRPVKVVTAATWAALQSACSNMRTVKQLRFLDSRVTAITYHVLQHVPHTIATVDFSRCQLNLMCAGEISDNLHGNVHIRVLDLSYAKLNSTEFVSIFQGMQMCERIQRVRLRGAAFDRPSVSALAEYIRLTHSLEVLDLSECELTTDMCTRLVSSIRQNRTITRLVLNGTKVTSEGREVISKTKTKVQPVFVEGLVGLYG